MKGCDSMAHVNHFNKQAVRNIIKEHERDTDHYKNAVDVSRSNLNFGYGFQTADEMALNIRARCNDIMQGKKMQDQTNVMSEWKITYPSWLCDVVKGQNGKKYHKPRDPKHVKLFFDTVYNFTVERYGADNVMGGYVHMDETTPHMHVDLVPEATSRKTGKKTVSSASLFNKTELQNYQRDLQKEMIKVFGKDASAYILNGRTKGDYTIEELKERSRVSNKQKTREKNITKKEQEIQDKEQALNVREQGIIAKEQEIQNREKMLSDREQNITNKENELTAKEGQLQTKEQSITNKENELTTLITGVNQQLKGLGNADTILDEASKMYENAKNFYLAEQDWLSEEGKQHRKKQAEEEEKKQREIEKQKELIRKKRDKYSDINEIMSTWGNYVGAPADDEDDYLP